MKRLGRPLKYADFFKILELKDLYAPRTIVELGEAQGLFGLEKFREDGAPEKVRMAMNRYAHKSMPSKEDGWIEEEGQPMCRAWYGWRWKDAIAAHYFNEKELGEIERAKKETESAESGSQMEKKEKPFLMRLLSLSAFNRKWRWVGGITVGGLALAMVAMVTVYPEGYRIFKEKGPGAALDYFVSFEKSYPNDPKLAFGKAWSKFAVGELDEAERDCLAILQNDRTPNVTIGNCYLLLGKIKMRTGHYPEAREYYGKCLEIFERENRPGNLYKTYCALAVLALESDDLPEAEIFLFEAEAINRWAEMNPGEVYQLRAEVAFRRHDYPTALDFSKRYHDANEERGNIHETVNAKINVGFYQLLNGDLEAAFQSTVEVQLLLPEIRDRNMAYYNLLNLLFVRRCEGKPTEGLVATLNKFIEEEGDQRLKHFVGFVTSFPCDSILFVEGDGSNRLLSEENQEIGEDNQEPPPDL